MRRSEESCYNLFLMQFLLFKSGPSPCFYRLVVFILGSRPITLWLIRFTATLMGEQNPSKMIKIKGDG